MQAQSNLRFLLGVSGQERYKLYTAASLSVVSSLLGIIPYLLLYQIILELFKEQVDYPAIASMAWWVGGVVVVRMLLFLLSGVFSHVAAFTILYELRLKAVQHLGQLHMGFFTGHTLGEMKKTINEDIEKLENFIAHQIPDLAAAAVTPLVLLGYMLYLEWRLALVLLLPLGLGMLSQLAMFRGMKTRMQEYHALVQRLNATIIQYIHGISVFKAFNLSAPSFKAYKEITEEYADFWVAVTRKQAPSYGMFLVLIDSGLLFILPVGGLLFLNGSISVSTYILFLILSANFLTSFQQLLEFGSTFSMLLEGAGKVQQILRQPVQAEGRAALPQPVQGEVEFQNISFQYDNKPFIKNLSLTIEPGQVAALVGPSGSGKTTLGQLLGRFWDIDGGRILLDGVDIRELPMATLMGQVSFVFQQVFMLQDTIYENVAMGAKTDLAKVMEACKLAQIHDFIMTLPRGYQTSLAEDGIKLSGGEKQRISIARAILKDSPIIVLDEVTAYSDIENESKIQAALKHLLENKTALIIAHRLYTIKNADKIIVLQDGKIIEQGTHRTLMQKRGLYRHLWDCSEVDAAGEGSAAHVDQYQKITG